MRELFPVLSGFKWPWNTVNESDLVGNQRVSGCQVGPGCLGVCVFVCLTSAPSSQNNTVHLSIKFPNRSSTVPVTTGL